MLMLSVNPVLDLKVFIGTGWGQNVQKLYMCSLFSKVDYFNNSLLQDLLFVFKQVNL